MNAPQSTYRLISGFSLLLMAIISPIGFLIALPAGHFEVTVSVALVVVVLDVIVALAMYPIIESGGRILGTTATVLRCAYALGLLIATVTLIFSQDASRFTTIWDQSLAIFGIHLILVGVLLCLSPKLPTFIGILVGITGIGYLVDAVAVFLGAENPGVSKFTFVGEVVLFIWLIYSGFALRNKENAML
ncbi:hypothetical protein FM102_01170 [Corynebacterium glutamicum]|uniref:DUF4386 family protein n=1 Tax=Corynebacterium glutamicum TaxID=1718 RepID=UPI00097F2859|nr:DUF4386 family protein [Corynebacterium glutamicum]SJM44973.1 hypothetical protein FM102_01170 [Corynebacterium glutamicum]